MWGLLVDWLGAQLLLRAWRRPPDFVIGGAEQPYLRRWWVIPRNRVFNVYLHQFLRPDDDRALHDHPWANCSVLLRGGYLEHTIAAGGIHHKRLREAGAVVLRLSGRTAHRVELLRDGTEEDGSPIWRPCWTLFITGPVYRTWGFHCPQQGWVPWQRFTADRDPGSIGRGCEG